MVFESTVTHWICGAKACDAIKSRQLACNIKQYFNIPMHSKKVYKLYKNYSIVNGNGIIDLATHLKPKYDRMVGL